ncbi:outer membrane protein transport protein [Pararhizobium mangrovi]|uniref:Transporter n=1 Tax=Pararhizobium mangrovi TaxID=2590452 RepID=A0A506U7L0_9HYPH|nr:outer membrane protein transport protein [Pararhizobium mangrovi]TPW29850.1 transporter [Pararhizobium mangrovi]
MRANAVRMATMAVVALVSVGRAHAGGLEREGYDIDLLFDSSPFAFETRETYVSPHRVLKHVHSVDGTAPATGDATSARESKDYVTSRIGMKFAFGEPIDCLFQYSQPWGAHVAPGNDWAGATSNIETELESDSLEATCSYAFDLGPGRFRAIGGVVGEKLSGFKEKRVFLPLPTGPVATVGRLDMNADGHAWRAGVAYEIPDIALRASLVYTSQVDLDDIDGSLVVGKGTPFETRYSGFASAAMPRTLALKLRSGIAPGWLAYGSLEWADWSVLQSIPFCAKGAGEDECTMSSRSKLTSLDLYYRDGWTVSGGVGHAITKRLTTAAGLTWDRGVSNGYGSSTDSWTVDAALVVTPDERWRVTLAGAAGVMTGGRSNALYEDDGQLLDPVSYDFDADFVGALSLSAALRF